MQGADHDCMAEARQTLLPASAMLSWIQNTSSMCSRRVEKRAAWCTDPLASSDYYIRTLVRDSIRENVGKIEKGINAEICSYQHTSVHHLFRRVTWFRNSPSGVYQNDECDAHQCRLPG